MNRKKINKRYGLLCLLLALMISWQGYGQSPNTILKPTVFTTIAASSQTLSNVSIVGTEKWFKWTSDTGIVKLFIKMSLQGTTSQLSRTELYTEVGTDSIVRVFVDSLRTDSTLRLAAGYVAQNAAIYIRVINVTTVCGTCSSSNPSINLQILSTLSGCNASVPCSIVSNGGFESSNGPCGGAPVDQGVDCWYFYENSSDCLRRYCGALSGQFNLGGNTWWSTPTINSHSPNPNNTVIGLATFVPTNTDPYYYSESVQSPLLTPLISGHKYELSFWAYNHSGPMGSGNNNLAGTPVWLAFATSSGMVSSLSPNPAQYSYYPLGLPLLYSVQIAPINTWTAYTYTFTFSGASGSNLLIGPDVQKGLTYGYINHSSNGRQYTAIDDVNIRELTTLTVTPNSMCAGKTAPISAFGANTYTWQPGGQIGSTVNVSPLGTTIYTVTGTYPAAPGCTVTGTTTVTVKPLPYVTATPASTVICPGTTVSYTSTGAPLFTWAPCSSGCATSNYIVTPTVTTTYTVTGYAANGCTNTAQVTATVLTPNNSISVSGTTIVCEGQYTTLTASGLVSYTWTPCSGCYTNSITVNPHSTTAYTLTGYNMCGMLCTKVVTVTVIPIPHIVAVAQPSVICTGQSSTLTASGASGPYDWTPITVSGNPVVVSPTVTSAYTAMYSVTGCGVVTGSVQVTVVNYSAISANLTTTNAFVCSGSTTNITANVIPAGTYTYNWNPSAPNAQTVPVSPTNNMIYNCTVVNVCGVTAQASTCVDVTATLCCAACGESMTNGTINPGGSLTNLSNATICLSGIITVAANVAWNNCTVRMGSAAKIVVKPGYTLTIKSSKVFSCQDMWEGIVLQSGLGTGSYAKINTLSSSIEDAFKAVHYDAQGENWSDNIITKSTTFNKNYIGISIANTSTIPAVISQNLALTDAFTGAASATSPGSSLKCSSFYLGIKPRPYAGVYFDNQQTNLHIGDAAFSGANVNTYNNLDYGVYLNNSMARTFNSNFTNLSGLGYAPIPPALPVGIGVYSSNSFYNAYHVAHVEKCKFNEVYRGVNVTGVTRYYVIASQFSVTTITSNIYGNTAINATNTSEVTNVSQNLITNFQSGTYENFAAPVATSIYSISVFQNTVTVSGTNTCAQALRMDDAVNTLTTTVSTLNVSSNKLLNVRGGILINNINANLRISNNQVNLQFVTAGTFTGIRLNGSSKIGVDNNTIGSTATTNLNLRGIYMQLSPACRVNCNTINTVGQSVLYEGNCLQNNSGFINNIMNTANDGLVFKNNAVVGHMGVATGNATSANNQWIGTFTNSKTLVMDIGSSALNSPMHVRNTVNELPSPQSLNKAVGTALNTVDNYGTITYNSNPSIDILSSTPFNCPAPNTTGLKLAAADTTGQALYKAINDTALYALVVGPGEDAVIPDEAKEISRAYVYELMDKGYSTSHSGLTAFYTSQVDSTIGIFNEVDSLIQAHNYTSAQVQSNTVAAITSIQQNQQLINSAILKSLMDTDVLFTIAEIDALDVLAHLCPLKHGKAVYQARSFLSLLAGEALTFADNCDFESQASRKGRTLNIGATDQFSIYPNPNNGVMTLSYVTDKTTQLSVYDVSGRILYSKPLDRQESNLQLSFQLSEGIYFYTVTDQKGTVLKTDKLVILK